MIALLQETSGIGETFGILREGGSLTGQIVLVILTVFSLISWVMILWKWKQFRTLRKDGFRFVQAIDQCAMQTGAKDTDSYLAEWRRGAPEPCGEAATRHWASRLGRRGLRMKVSQKTGLIETRCVPRGVGGCRCCCMPAFWAVFPQ